MKPKKLSQDSIVGTNESGHRYALRTTNLGTNSLLRFLNKKAKVQAEVRLGAPLNPTAPKLSKADKIRAYHARLKVTPILPSNEPIKEFVNPAFSAHYKNSKRPQSNKTNES